MMSIDGFTKRLAAEAVALEDLIKHEMELLEAFKKVQLYMASRNGSTARKLLEPAAPDDQRTANGHLLPHAWETKLTAVLETGPKRPSEIWPLLDMPGTRKHVMYQILHQLRKTGFLRGGAGAPYRLAHRAAAAPKPKARRLKKGGDRINWTPVILAALSDGKPRNNRELYEIVGKSYTGNKVARQRFSVAVPRMVRHGIIARQADGRVTLPAAKEHA